MYIRKTRIVYLAGVLDRMKTNIANFRATNKRKKKRERERKINHNKNYIYIYIYIIYILVNGRDAMAAHS